MSKSNKKNEKIETVEIDAAGKVLGRLSTEIATLLRGKNKPEFRHNKILGVRIVVVNPSKIIVTGNKMNDKIYYKHTGFIGHLKSKTMKEIFMKSPQEIIRRAVWGMLPKNKLRSVWIKNLVFKENNG